MYLDEDGLGKVIKALIAPPHIVDNVKFGNVFRAIRYSNNIVEVYYDSKTALSAQSNLIGTIEKGFRPMHQRVFPATTGPNPECRVTIATNGLVSIFNYNTASQGNTSFSDTYVTGDPVRQNPNPILT